ncbi:MAG: DDE endonuclease [Candidatus Syntrophoarchaeum caldarius]|uniref:DDE endonuclease n=1 Tax=Candidatus Syntropharchaeum caldarium TaxID=1838285 RepID=A0A1F2P8C7_9EURY|nr:MAG: DDE endonuclease [Candidatus Syntrophoarchaeum caldarius]
MYLVYLPPYSPDLNPIEFIWKSIKRRFSRLAESLSFAKSWIEKFIPSWI